MRGIPDGAETLRNGAFKIVFPICYGGLMRVFLSIIRGRRGGRNMIQVRKGVSSKYRAADCPKRLFAAIVDLAAKPINALNR